MKKCLSASLVTLLTVFTVSSAVEPLAALRVSSVEKLGSATTQLCGAIGQPMLGGMATGMLQQYIQTTIGPFDQTKPVAIVAYADPAKLEDALSKREEDKPIPTEGFNEVKAGLILPITMSGEEFARSKLLKLNAEGVAQLPGTPMFITFKGQTAFIASDSQTAQRLKIEAAHYQGTPANGDALSIEFFPPAIALYGNLLAKTKEVKKDGAVTPLQTAFMAFSSSSAALGKKQLAQFASVTLGLGFNQAKGLAIGWDTRYKPGTELAAVAAAAKPIKADLLATVPESAQFCQLSSMKTPSLAASRKNWSNLTQFVQSLLDTTIAKKYPELSKAITENLDNSFKLAEKCEQTLAAFGYDKGAKFWFYGYVTTPPGEKDAMFQSVLDENRKLASAMATAFPGKQFLAFDAPSATLTLDLAKLPFKELAEAREDGKKIDEKDLAELEKKFQSVHQVLTGGQPFRMRFVKTEDGYKTIASCDGAANLPKFTGNGKMAARAAKDATQYAYLDLFTLAKNVLGELAPTFPENEKKKLDAILALIPAGGPESGLTICEKIRGGVSHNEFILPPSALQHLSGIIATVSQGDDDDDDNK